MVRASIPRWVALRLARRPETWLFVLGLGALCPLLLRLLPFGAHAGAGSPWEMARAWCFPAALLGCALALATLAGAREFLARMPAGRRFLSELASLLFIAMGMQLPLALGAAVAAGGDAGSLNAWPLVGVLAMDLHLAVLALLVLGAGFPALPSVSVLVLVAWVAPCLLLAPGGILTILHPVVDASRHMHALGGSNGPSLESAAGVLPVVALGFLSWMVRAPLLAGTPEAR